MVTTDDLKKANSLTKGIDVKGKNYIMVNERLKAFREICPSGAIITEILGLAEGIVTMKATVKDEDGNILGTGHAQEKETSSYINKTSYIENCETSAIGRALGVCGIGIDDSMGSADEIANAILNQESMKKAAKELATKVERESFIELCNKHGLDSVEILKRIGWKDGQLTKADHGKAMAYLMKVLQND